MTIPMPNAASKPLQELQLAQEAILAMTKAETLDEFETSWKSCLSRLERVWSKTKDTYRTDPKWTGWSGVFANQRATDPLLKYLRNARNVDEHTVADITNRDPGRTVVRGAGEGSAVIHSGKISNGAFNGRAENLEVTFHPERTVLLPVVNQGTTSAVPHVHLGNPIDPSNVIKIAELGATYYANLLAAAQVAFP